MGGLYGLGQARPGSPRASREDTALPTPDLSPARPSVILWPPPRKIICLQFVAREAENRGG